MKRDPSVSMRQTFMTKDIHEKFFKIYASRVAKDSSTKKNDIICNAIELLYEKEINGK